MKEAAGSGGARLRCPLCGNDRTVRVTRFVDGLVTDRAVCIGPRACHQWFDPATGKATPKGWDETRAKAGRPD